MKILTLIILEPNEQQERNLCNKKSYCSPGGMHWSLLLGKIEAYSVLHTMYLWVRVG